MNNIQEVSQDTFLGLSFEELTNVSVSLSGQNLEKVELEQKEAPKVKGEEKPVDFLEMSFEQLVKLPVNVTYLFKNEADADQKKSEEVTSEGTNIDANIKSVFTNQSLQVVAPIVADVNSVPNEIKTTTTTDTSTTTTTVTPLPNNPFPIPSIPLVVPEFLAVSNILDATISILLNNKNGTFTVLPAFPVNGGGTVYSIAIGDFNRDGLLDLAAANNTTNDIEVFLAMSVGVFGAPIVIAGVDSPGFIVTNDFNGDGILDLACTNQNTNTMSIFLGLGNGNFGPPIIIGTGNSPFGLVSGDFNLDGILDLALVDTSASMVSIFLGSGTGFFTPLTSVPTGGLTNNIITGDFNNDGILDLATANTSSGSLSVLLGSGMGFFGLPTLYSNFTSPFFVVTGDFNKDGNLDLVTGDTADGIIYILFGTPSGTFGPKVPIGANGVWTSGTAADFNADGNLDLAITDGLGNIVAILLGNGDGTFQNKITYPVGFIPQFVGFGILPAGVSGSPITLGLTHPNEGLVSLKIDNLPCDWSITESGKECHGSWIFETTDLSDLRVITPQDFVGSKRLCGEMSWVTERGMVETISIIDNVEVYAPNTPIFALPGDHLSGSMYADTFVISKSQKYTQDKIYHFDAAQDHINLIDFTGVHQFSDLNIISDNQGNTVVNLNSDEQSILFYVMNPEDLTESNFSFNETPYTLNTHTIDIARDSIMPFKGVLENNGVIYVDGVMVMEGDITGSGKIIIGRAGVLEFKGHLDQDVLFETGSEPVIFNHMNCHLDTLTPITLSNWINEVF